MTISKGTDLGSLGVDNAIMSLENGAVYRILLNKALLYGQKTTVRGHGMLDLGFRAFTFILPEHNVILDKSRKLNYGFMMSELIWYLRGSDLLYPLSLFNKNISQFSDDGKTMFGAYGLYIHAGLDKCARILFEDRLSRQAYIPIHNMSHLMHRSKDIPCTLGFHFLSQDGEKLNLITHMRSQDLWWGFPYDMANFSTILCIFAAYMDFEVGYHIHIVDSLHIYEDKIPEIKKYLNIDSNMPEIKTFDKDRLKGWLTKYHACNDKTLLYEYSHIYAQFYELLSLVNKKIEPNATLHNLMGGLVKIKNPIIEEQIAVCLLHLIKKELLDKEFYGRIFNILTEINSPFRFYY